jgi:poly(3-hydroxyoctanoate) depolymerase
MTPATSARHSAHRELRIRGLRIHAQIRGEGEPLLMYSPIWSAAGVWEPLLPYLTGFRTIAFDPPGIGRSPRPALPMSMQALASVGAALLDELGIESAHVLGASFGGTVAQHMAICQPGRVRRLVLASTSFGTFAIPGHPTALWHIIHPGSHRGRMEEIAGDTFGGRLRTEPELVRAMPICSPRNIPAAVSDMAPLIGWTSLPWLWTIRQPTLVICGDDDPIARQVNHRIMAALIPHAQLHIIEGGGHVVLMDSPARVAPIITRFLRGGQPESRSRQRALCPRDPPLVRSLVRGGLQSDLPIWLTVRHRNLPLDTAANGTATPGTAAPW